MDATTPGAEACTLTPTPAGTVSTVIDGETLQLGDGTTVRLIGALAPRGRYLDRPWRVEQDSIAALRSLVLGKPVELATGVSQRDRHGRLLAHVFVERDGERLWVQGELLRDGQARAYNLPGHAMCLAELLAHEDAARRARRGVWAGGAFQPRDAKLGRDLLKYKNSFQIVQGLVEGVQKQGDWTHLKFGPDRRTDFTAGVKSARGANAARDPAELAALEGQVVEVRGWMDWRGGPYIEVWDFRQVRKLDPPAELSPASALDAASAE